MRLFTDTTLEAESRYLDLLAGTSPARKGEMISGLYQAALEAAAAGVRTRNPGAAPDEIRAALARLLLGETMAERLLERAGGGDRALSF